MKKNGTKNITFDERVKLANLLKDGVSKKIIALEIGRSLASVYREIDRGSIDGKYDPVYSQKRYESFLKEKRKTPVLAVDSDLSNRISNMILVDNMSPEQIYYKLLSEGINCPTKTTIYTAIYNGLIPNVTKYDLIKKTTNIYSNGLIQLPTWIRSELNLVDGDTLTIKVINGKIVLEPIHSC